MSGWVFLDWISTKQGLMCLTQEHNDAGEAQTHNLSVSIQDSTTKSLRSHLLGLKCAIAIGKACLLTVNTLIFTSSQFGDFNGLTCWHRLILVVSQFNVL